MKIIDITVAMLRYPAWRGETFDGSYDNCIVQIDTDDGLTDIAEVDSVPHVIRAIVEAPRSHSHAMGLKEILVGEDPLEVERLWTACTISPAITAAAALWSMRSALSTSHYGISAARLREDPFPNCSARRSVTGCSPTAQSAWRNT
jgi:L-alanine-DL-glutamate epimerase-like enolase superfamily enzyme